MIPYLKPENKRAKFLEPLKKLEEDKDMLETRRIAATTIQRTYRGHASRVRSFRHIRAQLDTKLVSLAALSNRLAQSPSKPVSYPQSVVKHLAVPILVIMQRHHRLLPDPPDQLRIIKAYPYLLNIVQTASLAPDSASFRLLVGYFFVLLRVPKFPIPFQMLNALLPSMPLDRFFSMLRSLLDSALENRGSDISILSEPLCTTWSTISTVPLADHQAIPLFISYILTAPMSLFFLQEKGSKAVSQSVFREIVDVVSEQCPNLIESTIPVVPTLTWMLGNLCTLCSVANIDNPEKTLGLFLTLLKVTPPACFRPNSTLSYRSGVKTVLFQVPTPLNQQLSLLSSHSWIGLLVNQLVVPIFSSSDPSQSAAVQRITLPEIDSLPKYSWWEKLSCLIRKKPILQNSSAESRSIAVGKLSSLSSLPPIVSFLQYTSFFVRLFNDEPRTRLSFLQKLNRRNSLINLLIASNWEVNRNMNLFVVLCECLSYKLYITNHSEIKEGKLVDVARLEMLVQTLKMLLLDSTSLEPADEQIIERYEVQVSSSLFSESLWEDSTLSMAEYLTKAKSYPYRELPFLVPFTFRATLFQRENALEKERNHSVFSAIEIRRDSIFDDSLTQMAQIIKAIRGKIHVKFISDAGYTEPGVDGGGLFKEYWTILHQIAFKEDYGLFCQTSDHLLYPNPMSQSLVGDNHLQIFWFLGAILGKAIYEGFTVQPQFAPFFLKRLLNKSMILNDLFSRDRTLYQSLQQIRDYKGDVSDLSLTYSLTDEMNKMTLLVPNGDMVEVTEGNKFDYISKVVIFKLHTEIESQTNAFVEGFNAVIPSSLLSLFNEYELQTLISGPRKEIDLADLRQHTEYMGYSALSPTILMFWKVISEFSQEDLSLLLRFVTSCERPPPLGFEQMHPPFTIHCVPLEGDQQRLPSASTCFNLLKLPDYQSKKKLKEMLLLAIRNASGFELS